MKNHRMPTMVQAGVYSSLLHYLKALEALGGNPHDGAKVVAKMKEMPTDDPLFGKGTIRRTAARFTRPTCSRSRSLSESKYPWDLLQAVAHHPGETRPSGRCDKSTCPLVKK